ncbi:MAG: hypothetical protein HQ517_14130, partial [SAR324 cluster bacterium]|nr:hypothetical protein [SAR324 cluster bacterium]
DEEDAELDAYEDVMVLDVEEDETSADESAFEEFDELEQDRVETKAIENELEEIGLDIDDYNQDFADYLPAADLSGEPEKDNGIREIAVSFDQKMGPKKSLTNDSKTGDIGSMEIKVVPLKPENGVTCKKEHQLKGIQADGGVEKPSSYETKSYTELQVTRMEPTQLSEDEVVMNTADSTNSSLPFMELEVDFFKSDDVIEIEHSKIEDEIETDYDAMYDEEFDDSELLEISVEDIDTEEKTESTLYEEMDEPAFAELPVSDGMDNSEIEEFLVDDLDDVTLLADTEDLDDLEVDDDILTEDDLSNVVISNVEDQDSTSFQDNDDFQEIDGVEDQDTDFFHDGDDLQEVDRIADFSQFESELNESETSFVEQDGMDSFERDFEADDTHQSDEMMGDQFELEMREIESLSSNNPPMSIQEMINFRQVMKAKYDIPETSTTDFDAESYEEEDLEIGLLSDDESDDFDLMDGDEGDVVEESLFFEAESSDDVMAEEYSEQAEPDESMEAEADSDEIDIFAEMDDYDENGDIDLFAEVGDDDIGENDLFTDSDTHADDPAEDLDLLAEEETLTDNEDLLMDAPEMEDETDELLLTEAPDADDDETDEDLLIDAPVIEGVGSDDFDEIQIDSDEIDLLSDDLQLSDDFTETADAELDGSNEPNDLFSDSYEDSVTAEDVEADKSESLEKDGTDDIFSNEDDDVFEEVELLGEETANSTEIDTSLDMEIPADQNMTDLEESDEVIIEVPMDVFEINDLKMTDLASEMGEDTEPGTDESPRDEAEFSEDIELPSMDEDLADPPFVASDGNQENDTLFEEDVIEVLQTENDFGSFLDDSETIHFSDNLTTPLETNADIKTPPVVKKKLPLLSPSSRDKLSEMIENAIADTIQSTLHKLLPDMVDKIMQEELDD